jgi:hypothetical protein
MSEAQAGLAIAVERRALRIGRRAFLAGSRATGQSPSVGGHGAGMAPLAGTSIIQYDLAMSLIPSTDRRPSDTRSRHRGAMARAGRPARCRGPAASAE